MGERDPSLQILSRLSVHYAIEHSQGSWKTDEWYRFHFFGPGGTVAVAINIANFTSQLDLSIIDEISSKRAAKV
jgi:hypothetical protein